MYDCEDSAHIIIECKAPGRDTSLVSNLRMSGSGLEKTNEVTIVGNLGTVVAYDDRVQLSIYQDRFHSPHPVDCSTYDDFDRMLHFFHVEIMHDAPSKRYWDLRAQDVQVTDVVGKIYLGKACIALGPTLP